MWVETYACNVCGALFDVVIKEGYDYQAIDLRTCSDDCRDLIDGICDQTMPDRIYGRVGRGLDD